MVLVNAGMHPFINNRDDKDLLFGSDNDFFDFEGFVQKIYVFKRMDNYGLLLQGVWHSNWL